MRFAIAIIVLGSCSTVSWSFEPDTIEAHVETILAENCLRCHGAKKRSGKFDARTIESLTKGGKRGPAIVAGDAKASRLIQLVQPGAKPHMPPGKKQLSDEQIQTLSDWVNSLPSNEQIELTSDSSEPPHASHSNESDTSSSDANRLSLPASAQPTTVINLLVQAGYASRGVAANQRSTDRQFVRRLYIDLIGRIPTVQEAKTFLADTNSNKRRDLVQQLANSDEYARRMADAFDTMLMGRKEDKLNERRQQGWHAYLESAFRENRPWNDVAAEVLLARGNSDSRGHLWFLYERNNKHQDIAEAIAKGFFGVDIACAQCHDHPLADEIHQAHYWGLVSFFNRSKNTKSEHGLAISESAIGGFNDYANALEGTTDKAVLTFLQRDPIDEQRPAEGDKQEDKDELYISVEHEPRVPRFSRREKFVEQVLQDHPLLARAMVNRIWALLMGRGLVHPVEKMDSNHPASHPQLLEWLSQDFADNGYDIRRLVTEIVNSDAYQLDSRIPDGNRDPAAFAYSIEKPLTAEIYLRSIAVALNISDEEVARVGKEFRKLFPEILPENNLSELSQSMLLSNRAEFLQLFDLSADKVPINLGVVDRVTLAYNRIFGRPPTDDELFAVGNYLKTRQDRPTQAMSQVLWAMVASAEFRFNH